MPKYHDPDFDPLACEDLDEMQFQTRALAHDLQARGLGLASTPLDLAREVYAALVMMRARDEAARDAARRRCQP